jgi:small redox-active disulfide protein 2
MKIQVLGPGCPRCEKLDENARAAVERLGLDADYEKVTKMADILRFNVMQTPALVVDGEVLLVGTAGSVDRIAKLLCECEERP